MIGMKDFVKRIGNKAGNGAQIIVVGGLTGLFAGIVVTLYNMLASMTEEFAAGYYGFFRIQQGDGAFRVPSGGGHVQSAAGGRD